MRGGVHPGQVASQSEGNTEPFTPNLESPISLSPRGKPENTGENMQTKRPLEDPNVGYQIQIEVRLKMVYLNDYLQEECLDC